MEKSRIIIVGASGSGKDYLKNKYISKGFKKAVSYTTRPPRDGEKEGVDYFFVDDRYFADLRTRYFFYEVVEFNGWKYGTTNKAMEEADVFIMTPAGIRQLSLYHRKTSIIIYIDVPPEIRYERLLKRKGMEGKIHRRMSADEEDFADFEDFDIVIKNTDF